MERGVFTRNWLGLNKIHGDVINITYGQISPEGVYHGASGRVVSSTKDGKASYYVCPGRKIYPRRSPK